MNFNFQKIIIIIALILLILSLAFISTAIINEEKNTDFPPVIAECPDYWIHDIENNKCVNDKNLGSLKEFNIDKNVTLCDKYNESIKYDFTWDGITNNAKLIEKC